VDERASGEGFVGRRRELAWLRGWVDDARTGAGRVVLLVGEPGIGKTRLAQELAGMALGADLPVAWGRCVEAEGAPAYWPWLRVLGSLDVDVEALLAGGAAAPEERFRLFDGSAQALRAAAAERSLVVIVEDLHWADEPSLLLLRHLAERLNELPLLLVVTMRDVEHSASLRRLLPDLLRAPGAERVQLRGFDLDEVGEQLGVHAALAGEVLEATAGNPLFVREVARAIGEGTWSSDRPPRSVLEVVGARVDRLAPDAKALVQAAAIVGRYFPLPLVAAVLGRPVETCLPLVDEAVAHGIVVPAGEPGVHRFVHALTRDAVEGSMSAVERLDAHRAVADAIESLYAPDLTEHLSDLARHWLHLAPYGQGATARGWAVRAAQESVRRLAFEEGVRLYRAALAADPATLDDEERGWVLVALGRAAYLAGDLPASLEAASGAAEAARRVGDDLLLSEAALVVEPVPDPTVNLMTGHVCAEALRRLGDAEGELLGVRARLTAQQSHLAYYAGERGRTEQLSERALALARGSGDDGALVEALRARQEALPGRAGREERFALGGEMVEAAARTGNARTAMWGHLWRIEAFAESGAFSAADDELPSLRVAADRVGGPVAAWHCDRTGAGLAQAQGRYAEAAELGRRAFERMRPIEPPPAAGAYLALNIALAQHVTVTEAAADLAISPFAAPPLFRTMGRLGRANLLLRTGHRAQAAAAYAEAGPVETWTLPPFFELPGTAYGALAALDLERHADLEVLQGRLEEFRGEHSVGNAVAYLGPTELVLGRIAVALGRLDQGVEDLTAAVGSAERAGALGFAAEARYHLAVALLERGSAEDRRAALAVARECSSLVTTLGMTAYAGRVAALLSGEDVGPLSPRESEVAELVAAGRTNRQIADALVISERTAQNHVQHILTKLGFTSRSQIAAWAARR